MVTHHDQEPTSLEELADYIGELLALVNGPLLHLVVPATAERELFIERVVERLGGGVVFTPNRRSTPWFSFDQALLALRKHRVVAFAPIRNPAGESGSDIEAIRKEAIARDRLLIIITDAVEWFEALRLEAPPSSVLRVELREAEMRVATLAEWRRAYLSIPRDGSKPELVVRDSGLLARLGELMPERQGSE